MSRYIDEHRGRFGVEPICRTLDVSASAYYQRATGRRSARAVEDERLLERIREVHEANYYAYGSRRMWKALQRAGEPVAALHGRAADARPRDLRRQAPRQAVADHEAGPGGAPAPGPRRARLHRQRPERALGRRHHLPALLGRRRVLRVRHRRLLAAGSSAGSSPRTCAPRSSSTRCGWRCISAEPGADVELVHHTDRGSQYTSHRLHPDPRRSRRARLVGSVGDAYDNALAESFVDSFKTELIADRVWRTRSQLELAIVEYVGWFNSDRLHQALGDLPPAEFEALAAPQSETITSTIE